MWKWKILLVVIFLMALSMYLFSMYMAFDSGLHMLDAIRSADSYMWKHGEWTKGWDWAITRSVLFFAAFTLAATACGSYMYLEVKEIWKQLRTDLFA